MRKPLSIPQFKNEDEEREFWNNIDLSEHFAPGDFVAVSFPNLKPTTRPVSVRLPASLLYRLKERANENNTRYQSLIKEYIQKGVDTPW